MTGVDRDPPSGVADATRVRRARPADEAALLAVQRELPRPNPALLRGALGGLGHLLVSTAEGREDGGRPVGYLLALDRTAAPEESEDGTATVDDPREETGPAGDADANASDDGSETGAYVAELAVAADHRREGRATELLRALLGSLDGGWVTLTVAPDNDAARRCYEAVGFRELRREPDFFDGDPALVLGRRVDGRP